MMLEVDLRVNGLAYSALMYVSHPNVVGWHKKHPENPLFEPMKTVNKLVSEGKLGMKTGEGFYDHKNSKK